MKPLRLVLAAASATALVTGLCLATTPALAAATPCWDEVTTDLDGGGPDVVVGLPSYDLPGKVDAGAIAIFSNVAAKGETDPKQPTASTILTADDFDGLSRRPARASGQLWRPGRTSGCRTTPTSAPTCWWEHPDRR